MRHLNPSRNVTIYSAYNPQQGQRSQGEPHDTLPEWTKLSDALEEHDDKEILGYCDDINTLLTFVCFVAYIFLVLD